MAATGPLQTFRGFQGIEKSIKIVEDTLYNGNIVAPILDIVCIAIGLIFVIYLVWNIGQQQKGNPQAQDALMKVGGGALGTILLLEVINILFFT